MVICPFTCCIELKQTDAFCLTIQYPEMTFRIKLDCMNEHIFVTKFFASVTSTFQRTVVLIIELHQFAVSEFIESASSANKHMMFICRIIVYAVNILISITGLLVYLFFIECPVVTIKLLNDSTAVGIRHS